MVTMQETIGFSYSYFWFLQQRTIGKLFRAIPLNKDVTAEKWHKA